MKSNTSPQSFNDIRLILNTAQIMSLSRNGGPLKLVTFDGDVTLVSKDLLDGYTSA